MIDAEQIQDIIITDDDAEDFEILSEAIRSFGVKAMISRAEDGVILMKLLEEKIPDLLFLDIYMPCKDGKSCMMEIRNNSRYDDMPIIIYTANEENTLINFCYDNGATVFLNKPDSYTALIEMLRKVLSMKWHEPSRRSWNDFVVSA